MEGNYDQAIRSYGNALRLIDGDNSLNTDSRTVLRSDINFDLAVVYYLKKDNKNANRYISEAFGGNPVKVMYVLEKSTQLKGLLAMLTGKK